LAVIQHDPETIIAQSRRALDYLRPDNLPVRTATLWTLGHAYQLQGDRAAAGRAFAEVIAISQSLGHSIYTLAATLTLGQLQEAGAQLSTAVETYRRVLHLAGDPPRPMASEAHLGLARIFYQWNDLEAAEQHGRECLRLTQQMESVDTFVSYAVFLARLRTAQGDTPAGVAVLAEAEAFVRRHNFGFRMPDIAGAQALTALRLGDLPAAGRLAATHALPISAARVHLAAGDPSAALTALEPALHRAEARDWTDERLQALTLQALARHAQGDAAGAGTLVDAALALAEPGGSIRVFLDEGPAMAQLLTAAGARGIRPAYIQKLLAAFDAETPAPAGAAPAPPAAPPPPLGEPLSRRELEILQLVAGGLSNREISERLFLALVTVKGHNQKIFAKLQVQRRTEAVARGRELGLL
jgi:LuxR family transcriptional regulator, maltose regulon positive regulatory protein